MVSANSAELMTGFTASSIATSYLNTTKKGFPNAIQLATLAANLPPVALPGTLEGSSLAAVICGGLLSHAGHL